MGRKRGAKGRKDLDLPKDIGSLDGKDINEIAEKMGEKHQGNKTQVRKIYNDIKKIQVDWNAVENKEEEIQETISALNLVRPKLAYAAARKKDLGSLKKEIDDLIENLNEEVEDVENFFKLMESFIGYHRYFTEKR